MIHFEAAKVRMWLHVTHVCYLADSAIERTSKFDTWVHLPQWDRWTHTYIHRHNSKSNKHTDTIIYLHIMSDPTNENYTVCYFLTRRSLY